MSTGPTEDRHPTVFVSYAHADPGWTRQQVEEWRTTVLRFTTLLCEMGIDAEVDQFHEHDPGVDWNRFGVQAARDQDFVLIVVSRAYRERWEGRNAPTDGPGVVRESDDLMGQFNENQETFRRRVTVVVLPGASADDIPSQLSGLRRFHLEELTEKAAEDLYRTLTGQPATPKPPLGPLRRMPPRRMGDDQMRAVEAAEGSGDSGETSREIADIRIALSRIQAGLATVPGDVRTEAELGLLDSPGVRAARQLLDQHTVLTTRLTELDPAEPAPPDPTSRQPARPHETAYAFVAIPLAQPFDQLYDVISHTLAAAGLRSVRADTLDVSGSFLDILYNAIEQAALVVGVASQAPPNVLYELAYARHLNKETLLLTDAPSALPADLRYVSHLVYSLSDLPAAASALGYWVAHSRFVTLDESRRTILRRGEVSGTVVDASVYLPKFRPIPLKVEIHRFLRLGASLPQRLLYETAEGQTTYLQLCDDPRNLYHQATVRFVSDNASSLIGSVLHHCGSAEVDFISIGPGDGRKDAVLLSELARRASPHRYTYYYPYDISGGLLLEATRTVLSTDLPLERVKIKTIEADVAYLGEFRSVFAFRTEPKVYSLLDGLTNMASEAALLMMLRRVMNAEDCLLLEVRKKLDRAGLQSGRGDLQMGDSDLIRRLDLAPLRYIGAQVDPASVAYHEVPSNSAIPNGRTVAAIVPELELDARMYSDVPLFAIHYYEGESLTAFLGDIGFRVLFANEGDTSLFYVCAPS